MDNHELLENLAQLQRCLAEVESARQMVANTVNAYSEVAENINQYSVQLSQVSTNLEQLIAQISSNSTTLSGQVDSRINSAINRLQDASAHFSDITNNASSQFGTKTNEFIENARRAVEQSTRAAQDLQTQSVLALETAADYVNSVATNIGQRVGEQLTLSLEKTRKSVKTATIILSILIIAATIVVVLCR